MLVFNVVTWSRILKHFLQKASSTFQLHYAAKNAFDYVLLLFMTGVNSVTDGLLIFSDKTAFAFGKNDNDEPLIIGLDLLRDI